MLQSKFYKKLNNFFLSKTFKYLPLFLKKKVRKFFKIYFCLTNLHILPKNNYETKFSLKYQEFIIQNLNRKYRSKNSYSGLLNLLNKINLKKKKINFLDFGAGDINTYLDLKKNKNIDYYYYDLKKKRKIIMTIKKKYKFLNLHIIDNINKLPKNIDFIFFGSSIGYTNNFKKIILNLIKNKVKYFFFSGTILYKEGKKKFRVLKQLNLLPEINYLYIFNRNYFFSLFKNKYNIIFIKKNSYKKINFKNLFFFDKKIYYVDFLLKKN